GDWRAAVNWVKTAKGPDGWASHELSRSVATGLLRMGLSEKDAPLAEAIAEELEGAPPIIREHGALLVQTASDLAGSSLLDGAIEIYEQLVEESVAGRGRRTYAIAARYAVLIRSLRRVQGREAEFDRYYDNLFATYPRLAAFKDELRKAVESPDRPKR